MNPLQFDKNHLWHPYTSATHPLPTYLVEKASGVRITLDTGQELIEGMSSWWSKIYGYNHPVLNKALLEQSEKMSHVMFGGLTHRPAIELGQKLLDIVPQGLERVFYCDSGSVAVEVSMKMALQYWHSKGQKSKTTFATIEHGYHGDTWHAMSVCDPNTGMHHIYKGKLPVQHILKSPTALTDLFPMSQMDDVDEYLHQHGHEIAAFILEPTVQGAGGMRFYHPQYLTELRKLCDKHEILLIVDEIATGFGRAGDCLFASEFSNISPDIMCVGKAITGGYMSFGATLCTEDIAQTISNGSPGVFMHGPTFMGNPLACALSCASIDLIHQENALKKVSNIRSGLRKGLKPIEDHDAVAEVRVLGAIGVVEMKENVDMEKITKALVNNGIWLRPFGKLIYTMPPYIISEEDLSILTASICKTIEEVYA